MARVKGMTQSSDSKTVLVTGATGFVGSHCLQPLLDAGFTVIAVTSQSLPPHRPHSRHVQWEKVDLLDNAEVKSMMRKIHPSHLLHLAWGMEHGVFWSSKANYKWLEASLFLLRMFAEQGGERVEYIGSGTEYDWRYGYMTEDLTPCAPKHLYGLCKNEMSRLFENYVQTYDLSGCWSRLFFLYGPGEGGKRFVSSLIKGALCANPVECASPGLVRDYLYVQDAADALVALLLGKHNGAVNVASGRPVTLGEITTMIGESVGKPELVRCADTSDIGQDPFVVANCSRLFSLTGWRPKISLEDGLKLSINWWRAQIADS